ncbi:UbiA family prenyltransferase [Lacticaseibacillus saniviri]
MSKSWFTWPTFVAITEIYIAPLNVIWFILGTAAAQYLYGTINLVNVILCLLDVFIFDLAVNVSDNYFDYKHAHDREYYTKKVNVIGKLNLPLSGVRKLMIALYVISAIPGFFLFLRTGWAVLIFGAIGYFIGIFYTAGKFPINATPLAETTVALSISYLIQLTCVYVCLYGQHPFTWQVAGEVFLVALPQTLIFFGVQLANNIADLKEDIANHRYTLPYFTGANNAITIMKVVNVVGALWPLANVALGFAPWPVLFSSLILIPMWRGLKPFFALPDKQKTYMGVIKSTTLFFIGYTLLFTIGSII